MEGEALIVKAGGARFALPMARIAEVRAYTPETRVPGTPPAIRGIVERNGRPVHVLDPVRRLFDGDITPGSRACIVFFDRVAGRGDAAMLVEEVERIVDHGGDESASPLDIDALFGAEQP
jgi:purine-binding chemotaxis protein CheW